MKYSGTISRGVKAPIIKKGDDLVQIVNDCLLNLTKYEGVVLQDKDVVCLTEAIVGRSQGNYATCEQIASDVKSKFSADTVGLVFPIFSRNRFSLIMKGISMGVKNLVVQLSFPADEVGNKMFSMSELYSKNIPANAVFSQEEFKKIFPNTIHEFTGVDYIEFYKSINTNITIILSNDPRAILKYTDQIVVANIHERVHTKELLKSCGAKLVYGLDDILTKSVDSSGFHPQYGLLGSNLATSDSLKLFPRDCQELVEKIQTKLKETFNKNIEVMVYGDGAFKDPQGGIWELADPVVSPGFTSGLKGTPNELKLKYLADNKLGDLKGQELIDAMKKEIKNKNSNLKGKNETLGTTPRQLTDLLGSLADLTSGSGDKGTPIILIQNYFKNYADD